MQRRKLCPWFFVWFLPLAWAGCAWGATEHSGDEHMMFVVGSIAGFWIFAILDNADYPSIQQQAPLVIAAGAAAVAVVGLLLDWLRASRRIWAALWAVIAVAVCVTTIASYPSYQRAIAKNGSLLTYVYFSINYGLYLACIFMLIIAPLMLLFRRRTRPGHCRQCDYDLTGNVSGVCPECGTRVSKAASRS